MNRGKCYVQHDHFSERSPAFHNITNAVYSVVKYLLTFALEHTSWEKIERIRA